MPHGVIPQDKYNKQIKDLKEIFAMRKYNKLLNFWKFIKQKIFHKTFDSSRKKFFE